MQNLRNLLLVVVLVGLTGTLYAGGPRQNAAGQQGGEQNASPSQQQPQASSSAAVRSVTGCLIRTDNGYSLKTDTDTLPIETDRDLSQYVNKKIKVTGTLEHHQTATQSATGGPVAMTDLRLRLVASLIGDCDQASK
jgi:hypothetical protein